MNKKTSLFQNTEEGMQGTDSALSRHLTDHGSMLHDASFSYNHMVPNESLFTCGAEWVKTEVVKNSTCTVLQTKNAHVESTVWLTVPCDKPLKNTLILGSTF